MATTTTTKSPQPPPSSKPRPPSQSHIPLIPPVLSNSPSHSLLHSHCTYLLSPLQSLLLSSPTPSFRMLDIGPGSGRLTTDLAAHLSLSSPQVSSFKITALDSSPSILSSARAHSLSRGFDASKIEYLSGSATDLPFASGSFDAVHVSQVLSHLKGDQERVKAVREMVRVVRKGGMVFIREGDLRDVTLGPEEGGQGEVLGEFYRVLGRLQERDGGVVDGGRRLEGWILDAGVGREKVRVGYGVSRYDTREERVGYAGFWPGRCIQGMFAEKAEEMGVAREKLEQFAIAWKDWMNTDDAFLAIVHGEAVIRM